VTEQLRRVVQQPRAQRMPGHERVLEHRARARRAGTMARQVQHRAPAQLAEPHHAQRVRSIMKRGVSSSATMEGKTGDPDSLSGTAEKPARVGSISLIAGSIPDNQTARSHARTDCTPSKLSCSGWMLLALTAERALSTRSCGPAIRTCSVLRRWLTLPTFSPDGLKMPICAPT